jgi:hypothetical protein
MMKQNKIKYLFKPAVLPSSKTSYHGFAKELGASEKQM